MRRNVAVVGTVVGLGAALLMLRQCGTRASDALVESGPHAGAPGTTSPHPRTAAREAKSPSHAAPAAADPLAPPPKAMRRMRDERHNLPLQVWAVIASAFSKDADPRQSLESLHAQEARLEPWASTMENTLRRRFAPATLAQFEITELALLGIDCRASTCVIEYDFPDGGTDPFDRMRSGPFASVMGAIVRRSADGFSKRVKAAFPLAFSEREIDPRGYEDWVRANTASHRAAGR